MSGEPGEIGEPGERGELGTTGERGEIGSAEAGRKKAKSTEEDLNLKEANEENGSVNDARGARLAALESEMLFFGCCQPRLARALHPELLFTIPSGLRGRRAGNGPLPLDS